MKFSKSFRGYTPYEVDAYLEKLQKNYDEILAQKSQRLNELSDENADLRKTSEKYREKEQSIVDSLVSSQKVAETVRAEADKYAEVTVLRAKEFYAAWQSYAQTLVKSLSDAEVAQFNEILSKMEQLVNDFEGGDIRDFSSKLTAAAEAQTSSIEPADKPQNAEAESKMQNPVKKVEEAAGERKHIIELEELLVPKESLDDLCRSLGVKKD